MKSLNKILLTVILCCSLLQAFATAERIQFVFTSGETLTYEALSPDGLTVRTVAGTSLPEISSTGYYTVSDGGVLIGDAVVISDSVRVIGGGTIESNFDPAVDVVANVTLVDTATLVTTTTTNTDMRGTDSAALATGVNVTEMSGTLVTGQAGQNFDYYFTNSNNATGSLLDDVTNIAQDVDGLNGDAMRGTNSANTTVPLAAAVDQAEHDATQVDIAALNDFDPAVDVVANVTLVDTATLVTTTTTNTDMRGTNSAALATGVNVTEIAGETVTANSGTNWVTFFDNATLSSVLTVDHVTFIKDYSEGDTETDTATTPWQQVIKKKGTATELSRKDLTDTTGSDVTNKNTIIGNITEP